MAERKRKSKYRPKVRCSMPRREFLKLLAAGGAAAVMAACAGPQPTATVAPTQAPPAEAPATGATATTVAPPTAEATTTEATAAPAKPLIYKPAPVEFFYPFGTNAEMRFEVMANQEYVTPNSLFYLRSHTGSLLIDAATWNLEVKGDGVDKPLTITYKDLLAMPATTVTRYVECAGNGRSFYDTMLGNQAQGTGWKLGGWGLAEWTGVQLSEILNQAGIKQNAVDVNAAGMDTPVIERPIPVAKAMEPDTLVAYAMNGDLLPPDHGFPARMMVSGWVGICSIKWLGSITVSTQPIYTDKNTNNYVFIGPDYQPEPNRKGPVVEEQVLKSAVALPWPAQLKAGQQKIVGYAWSPAGKIAKVDVSLDGGKSFEPATLTGPNIEKAGTRWEFEFDAQAGETTVTPRATDDQGNVQPDVSQQKWNQLGYVFGAMVPHPVQITV